MLVDCRAGPPPGMEHKYQGWKKVKVRARKENDNVKQTKNQVEMKKMKVNMEKGWPSSRYGTQVPGLEKK